MLKRAGCVFVAALAAGAGCGESTSPPEVVPFQLTGSDQTDTAAARLFLALIAELTDSSGVPIVAEVVRFEALVSESGQYVRLASLTGSFFGPLVADSTDERGHAAALVQLGHKAGVAHVAVSVPMLGYADTADFTILPASPATVTAEPADTVLLAGRTYTLRAHVADRFGNPRSETPTLTALDATVAVSGTTVTGQAVGRGRIRAAFGAAADTAFASVVPVGTFAASTPDGITIVQVDGSQRRVIPATQFFAGGYPSWNPTATQIVAMLGITPGRLSIADVATGLWHRVITGPDSGLWQEVWPSYTRDGSWIYFVGASGSEVKIWRVRPDGSELGRISPLPAGGFSETYPSPSPDGARLVMQTSRLGSTVIAVLDISTGQITSLGVNGVSPRWAPISNRIAYIDEADAAVKLINADGSGARSLTGPGHGYHLGLDWSPDEQWLLASTYSSIDLINVQTGEVLSLPYTAGWWEPAWMP